MLQAVLLLAEGELTQITAGLGVIAGALIVGQFLVYKYIVTPDREGAKKTLADEQARSAKALDLEIARSSKAMADEVARSQRLEDEIRRQNEVLQEKALPALIAATSTIGESHALLRELKHDKELAERERERIRERDRDWDHPRRSIGAGGQDGEPQQPK